MPNLPQPQGAPELPLLPKPVCFMGPMGYQEGFTADHMRAYVLADRAAGAEPVLDVLRELLRAFQSEMPPAEAGQEAQNAWATACAAAGDRAAALLATGATQVESGEAMRSALQDALEFIEHYSHAWNGVSAKHPNTIATNARAALAAPAPADRAASVEAVSDEQILATWNAWPKQGITSRARAIEFVRAVLAAPTPPETQGSQALAVSPEAATETFREALDQERAKFQQETRRTSELSVLLRKWVARHEAEHGPGPWAKSCEVCSLVGGSRALLDKPINEVHEIEEPK